MSGQAEVQEGKRRVLDRVPMWARSRWPLRRFFWQAEEIETIRADVERMERWFDAPKCSRCRDTGWCCADQPDPHRCRCGAVPADQLRKPTPDQVERARERHQEKRAVRGPEPAADQLRKEGT